MEYVETEGDSVDEAIANALKLLGVERDRVEVEVVTKGRTGIFGLGARRACVRASLRTPAPSGEAPGEVERQAAGQHGKAVVEEVLRLMGIDAAVEVRQGENPQEIIIDIRTGEGGLLIGHRGQILEALEYLVIRIVDEKRRGEEVQLVLDTERYRERHRRSLEDLALRLGEKAKRQRKAVSVDALSAADRRIINAALEDDPWLTTKSLGSGPYRRLLIIPEGDRKRKEPEKRN
jgi:spoIIIJ-associated protein